MNLDIRHWHCGSSQYQDTGRLVGLDIHPWHWGSILSAQHQAKLARSQFRPKTLDIARYSGLLVPSTEHPGSTPRGRILFSPFLLFSATHYNRSTRDLPPRSQPRRSSSVDGGGAGTCARPPARLLLRRSSPALTFSPLIPLLPSLQLQVDDDDDIDPAATGRPVQVAQPSSTVRRQDQQSSSSSRVPGSSPSYSESVAGSPELKGLD